VAAALFGFTAVSPAVLPGIAGADELPLTEPPSVEGEVTDDPRFAVALLPPPPLPTEVPEVVDVVPVPLPPAAWAYTTGELARAIKAALVSKQTMRFFMIQVLQLPTAFTGPKLQLPVAVKAARILISRNRSAEHRTSSSLVQSCHLASSESDPRAF
jgi:hypothetical protein